jgi:DNA-binding GntR family transcriptional regulator
MASAPPLERITFEPLHGRVYADVRNAIMSGRFEPGQKLTSRKLARMLGTSDMPVRAAISRLSAERGVEQLSNGTFIVPILSRAEFREVMELRAILEGRATGIACDHVDPAGFRDLRRHADALESAAAEGDIVAYLKANQLLKFTIYHYCDSPTLIALIEILWLRIGPALRHHLTGLPRMERINYHRDAIAALEGGDRAAAQRAISRDILAGMRSVLATATFADDKPAGA